MPTEKLTIRHIAKLAGTSRSSVSRVLNDHPNVSPEVRARVREVIAETGYQPDPIARPFQPPLQHHWPGCPPCHPQSF